MKSIQVIPGRYYIDATGRLIGPMVEGARSHGIVGIVRRFRSANKNQFGWWWDSDGCPIANTANGSKPTRLVEQVPGNEDLAHLVSLSSNKPHAEEKPRLVAGAWYMDAYGNAVGPMASDNGYLFHCLSGAWVGNAKWFSDGSVASWTYSDGAYAEPAPLVARAGPPSGASSNTITIEEALLDPGKPNKNYDGLSFDQDKLKKIIEVWAKNVPSWSHQVQPTEAIYGITGGKAVKRSLPLPSPKKPDPPKQVQPYKPPVRRRLQLGRPPEQPDPPPPPPPQNANPNPPEWDDDEDWPPF